MINEKKVNSMAGNCGCKISFARKCRKSKHKCFEIVKWTYVAKGLAN